MSKTVLLILVITAAQAITYFKSANEFDSRSTLLLPYVNAGDSLRISINAFTSAPFILELWAPNVFFPATATQRHTLGGSQTFISPKLTEPGQWRLTVLPESSDAIPFLYTIDVQTSDTRTSLGRFADVARYQRMFVLYHQSQGQYQTSVFVAAGFLNQVSLKLYGPFSSFSLSGGNLQTGIRKGNQIQLAYRSEGQQFYYLVIQTSQALMTSRTTMRVIYTTDSYKCPYQENYQDYNAVFAQCTFKLPTRGYPCSYFDNNLNTCVQCFQPYRVDSQGICRQDTQCPPRQYFSFGQCYDVIENCKDFEIFGGRCLNCMDNFELIDHNNGTQTCRAVKSSACLSNQFKRGDVCVDFVANCIDFEMSTGICHSCQIQYNLKENKCVLKPRALNCNIGLVEVNGACVIKDQFCALYNNFNQCQVCAKSHKLTNGRCVKIECKLRQYIKLGECSDVSPTCLNYDPNYGHCLTCIYNYFLVGKTCLQGIPSATIRQAQQGQPCPSGFYKREGTCVKVNPLCGLFKEQNGQCITCVNSSYYLIEGACRSIVDYCGYRTYFSNGDCLPVSYLCDLYDPTTGYCLSCQDNTKLNNVGRCLYDYVCKQRQYYAPDGSCKKVSDLCQTYNDANGDCLSCVKEHELNGGICCWEQNYMNDEKCKPFMAKNCKEVHPRFSYCDKCEAGYSKGNFFFGQCKKV